MKNKIKIFIIISFLLSSCSDKLLFNKNLSSSIEIKIIRSECVNGKVYLHYKIKNSSLNKVVLIKTLLEFPGHTIINSNGITPKIIKSIHFSSNDSDFLNIEPKRTISIKVEAKFLNLYLLFADSEYEIDLHYINPITKNKKRNKGYINKKYIGKVKILFCE
jgi:hypothetical protein